METLLFASYFASVAGMGWNLAKIKLQGDLEADMKGYREYDLSTEKIKVGTDKIDPDGHYIVLAKHRPEGEKSQSLSEQRTPFFSYTIPHYAPYDPTRYLEVSPLLSLIFLTTDQSKEGVPTQDHRRVLRHTI